MRSCSRLGRPCQNSIVSGATRQPPQCSGSGTSLGVANRCSTAASRAPARRDRAARCDWSRRPRADPAAARTRVEVGRRLLAHHALHAPRHAHLPLELRPPEHERRARIGVQLAALAAAVVRVEHEAARVHALEQHHARVGCAVGVGGREHHRVGLDAPSPRAPRRTTAGTARSDRRPRRPRRRARALVVRRRSAMRRVVAHRTSTSGSGARG